MKKLVRQTLFVMILLSLVISACAPVATPAPTTAPADTVAPAATDAPTAAPTTAAADPFGKYADAVTMTTVRKFETTEKLPAGDTPENNQYTRYVKDQLNIETKYLWTAASADYEQKVDLAISSNDLPDAMEVNLRQFTRLAHDVADTHRCAAGIE